MLDIVGRYRTGAMRRKRGGAAAAAVPQSNLFSSLESADAGTHAARATLCSKFENLPRNKNKFQNCAL